MRAGLHLLAPSPWRGFCLGAPAPSAGSLSMPVGCLSLLPRVAPPAPFMVGASKLPEGCLPTFAAAIAAPALGIRQGRAADAAGCLVEVALALLDASLTAALGLCLLLAGGRAVLLATARREPFAAMRTGLVLAVPVEGRGVTVSWAL